MKLGHNIQIGLVNVKKLKVYRLFQLYKTGAQYRSVQFYKTEKNTDRFNSMKRVQIQMGSVSSNCG